MSGFSRNQTFALLSGNILVAPTSASRHLGRPTHVLGSRSHRNSRLHPVSHPHALKTATMVPRRMFNTFIDHQQLPAHTSSEQACHVLCLANWTKNTTFGQPNDRGMRSFPPPSPYRSRPPPLLVVFSPSTCSLGCTGTTRQVHHRHRMAHPRRTLPRPLGLPAPPIVIGGASARILSKRSRHQTAAGGPTTGFFARDETNSNAGGDDTRPRIGGRRCWHRRPS